MAWKKEVVQPIFLAVEYDMPDIVLKLLEAGASIDTVERDAHECLDHFKTNDQDRFHGNSLLDTVVARSEALREALEKDVETFKPPMMHEDKRYLEGNIIKGWEEYGSKKTKEEADRPGKQQKLEALTSLQTRYVDLQKQLRTRGAKSLEELHPNMARRKDDEKDRQANRDFFIELALRFKVSASDEILEGYQELFQAAWEGNNDKIKALTLADWGPQKDRKPLHVTTEDHKGFNPFAIAMFRRHLATAKLLLGIANAQFKESDDSIGQRRYEIASGSDYDSYNSDEDSSEDASSEALDLSPKVVDDTYTYDNIAELQDSVGSDVSGKSISDSDHVTLSDDCLSDIPPAAEMLWERAAVWWFFDKPKNEARDAVGCGQLDIESTRYCNSSAVGNRDRWVQSES
ncbi:MAG: hypothetical protein Q9173_005359 [Seirophora scorigena]